MKSLFVLGAACGGVCAAIALAVPASADPAPGNYTATMIDPGATGKESGSTTTWNLAPCGIDCLRLATAGTGWDLLRQGDQWVGHRADGTSATMDNNNLIITLVYPGHPNVTVGLTAA